MPNSENVTVNVDLYFCTGSLVTTRRVLTIGYCALVLDEAKKVDTASYVDVYLGDLRITSKNEVGEVKVTARHWRPHPEYRKWSDVDFDVALVFLDTAVTLSPQVQLLSLPPASTYRIGNDPVDVAIYGWGRSTLGNYSGIRTHCWHTNIFTVKLRPRKSIDRTLMRRIERKHINILLQQI
jgi:hypothetical protein